MALNPVSISNGGLFQCTLGQMWTFITHKGVWIQCDSNLGCNNDKNQRHHILSYISSNFSKSTRRNVQDVQKPHHQHGCCGRPIPVEPYSPHSKLAPLVRLGYMAHASVLVSWLWSTNTMKRIILCAHNVGSYAFTSRNRKSKKNVPLETRPSKNVPPVSCMGTLWNAMPTQENTASLAPCNCGPLHCVIIMQGGKKSTKSAHAGTRSFCNFSKQQQCEKNRKTRLLDVGAYAKFFQNINVKTSIKEIVYWLIQLCSTSIKQTVTILNLFKDKVRLG